MRSKVRTDFSIVIPEPASVSNNLAPDREVTFDLPILVWAQDKLRRGQFVKSIAKLILRDQAPVIGVVGPFGEGKTSTLNLLGESLRSRSDLIIVRFSSWLPGDEQTLAISLFATIGGEIRNRFLVFGLNSELRRFAKLLVGVVPKVGGGLSQFFDPASQIDQLREMKRLLGRLPVRVLVLVDELDRMDQSELLTLLKAIRGVADLPNLTYVCGFDTRAVERLICPEDRAYGEFYLEKFFPVRVSLPRIDLEVLGEFFDRQMEFVCKDFGFLQSEREAKQFDEAIRGLWLSSIRRELSNFRRMSVFFNALRMALAPVCAEVNLFDMLVLQLIKLVSEETYEFIYDNGPLFYDAGLRIKYWEERLSTDENRESEIRKRLLGEHIDSLARSTKARVSDLLSAIFPAVRHSLENVTFSRSVRSSEDAESEKRIYHPDYFPRYFIHQVPTGVFGQEEMSRFIVLLNSSDNPEHTINTLRDTFKGLAANPWKRWDFLHNLATSCERLGDAQSAALVQGIAAISDSMESDVLGLGEWGRARAIIFVAAKRFSGTPKLQRVICDVIRDASSDGFAADIMRFSTVMRDQNKIITDWTNVDEGIVRAAFADRMRNKYAEGSQRDIPYHRGEDSRPFFTWAGLGPQDRDREVRFFRQRFQQHPAEIGMFLNWIAPKNAAYESDPVDVIEKLFPANELYDLIVRFGGSAWAAEDKERVQLFVKQIEKRRGGTDGAMADVEFTRSVQPGGSEDGTEAKEISGRSEGAEGRDKHEGGGTPSGREGSED